MTKPVALFFSPAGRLSGAAFWLPVVVVYGLGIAALILPSMTNYWIFAFVQMVLAWSWYVLHAKRLRDAARTTDPAAVIAALYVVAVVILSVGAAIASDRLLGGSSAGAGTLPSPGAALVILILYLIGVSSEAGGAGTLGPMLKSVAVTAALPIVVAIGFSIWVGTRPATH